MSAPSRPCRWCRAELAPEERRDMEFCGKKCRQAAWRLRRRRTTEARHAEPMRFAYADPPYAVGDEVELRDATVTIGRDGMGEDATSDDYDAFVAFVSSRIDELTGLNVTVESTRPSDAQDVRHVADCDDDRIAIDEALTSLWEEFCADTSLWPSTQASTSQAVGS